MFTSVLKAMVKDTDEEISTWSEVWEDPPNIGASIPMELRYVTFLEAL